MEGSKGSKKKGAELAKLFPMATWGSERREEGGGGYVAHLGTYIVLVRTKIGWPKNDGTFSSISECVLMKFNVGSGSVRESLWQAPGRGSGTYKGDEEEENEKEKLKWKTENISEHTLYDMTAVWLQLWLW